MVIIEGWPANIPFRNLSEASNSLAELEILLQKWRCGKVYWREVTEIELQDLDRNRNSQIESGELEAPTPRRRHSDYGKKRPRTNPVGDAQKKSGRVVNSHEEEAEDAQSSPGAPDTEG